MKTHPSELYETEKTEDYIYLPNSVPRNYPTSLNKQGDCGACVLAGLLKISIEDAYENHESGCYHGGNPIPKIYSFCRSSMLRTLERLNSKTGPIAHIVKHTPIFPTAPYKEQGMPFGLHGVSQFDAWTDYIRALLAGGYYGVAQVYNNGHRDTTFHEYGMTNHWVLIKGWRLQWYMEPKNKEQICSGMGQQEICISNSARNSKHEEWVSIDDFLRLWGGFDAYWVKLKPQ